MDRFRDKNLSLYSFSNKILVHCPNCDKKAEVVTDKHEIFCNECGYYAKKDKTYFSLNFNRNCPECGKQISFKINKVTSKKERIKVTCPHCKFNDNYKPKYVEHPTSGYGVFYGESQKSGKDCIFGAELWLAKKYKQNLFWANNYEHLEYLKEYIQAKIREQNEERRMSMVAKLPLFIKSKKNRDDLLKIIEQLRNK